MISAFKARPIYELKARDKSKIESLLAYGDRLLVGLNTGSLRIYRVNEVSDEVDGHQKADAQQAKTRPVELLQEEEKFSRKPIQQLAMFKEANLLISLSDAHVSFHDLQTHALSERLEKTKGATSFAVTSDIVKDADTAVPTLVSRLAVAVRRKILVWTWQDGEPTESAAEYSLSATVKTLVWATGTKIIAGMDPGYYVLDTVSQHISDVTKPGAAGDVEGGDGARFGAVASSGMSYMGMGGWIPEPMVTKLSDGELLLAKDVNTLFVDCDGKALEKRQVPWAIAPKAIGYSYPYMLNLKDPAKGGLEVRNPDTMSLLQSVPLPNAALLHVPQPNISLAHAGKGFLVASERSIWRMSALPYERQIDELVSQGRFDEALSLLNLLEDTLLDDKPGRTRDTMIRKANMLFEKHSFRDSLDLFAEASAPPQLVIGLFPKSVVGEDDTDSVEARPDTSDDTPKSPRGHSRAGSDADRSSIRSGTKARETRSPHKVPEAHVPLEGRTLMMAVNELCSFLVQTRTELQKYLNFDGTLKEIDMETALPSLRHFLLHAPSGDVHWQDELHQIAILVDTTLLRAYMLVRPQLAGSFFRLKNFCEPKVVEEMLYSSERYVDLIEFLSGKKMHKQALALLERFGTGDAGGDAAESLRGPQRTVQYLQQLPFESIDLVLQYAEWPIRSNASLGMEIFLADTEQAETLPRDKVVEFLYGIDSKLALQYLEHIVLELGDTTPEFHDRLIGEYVQRLKSLQTTQPKDEVVGAECAKLKHSLESFAVLSKQYNRGRILRELPNNEPAFYETRAIVYGKQGQHKKALEVYVFQLQAYEKAEEYCNETYLSALGTSIAPNDPDDTPTDAPSEPHSPSHTQQQSIYTILLSLYLNPPSPRPANLDAALALVSNHGARLPALNTINLLPTTLPIKNLESYFTGRMRAANSLSREQGIIAALRSVDKNAWEAALLLGDEKGRITAKGPTEGRNRRVVIDEDRMCTVCHKRFGRTAVRVWPDGEVVHYGCVDRRRQMAGSHGRKSRGQAAPGLFGP